MLNQYLYFFTILFFYLTYLTQFIYLSLLLSFFFNINLVIFSYLINYTICNTFIHNISTIINKIYFFFLINWI